MSVVVFDIELAGPLDNALNMVIVHHDSFEQVSFPLHHILNVAADELGWPKPWVELRSQENGDVLTMLRYEKDESGYWNATETYGTIPEIKSRVDLYLLDHKPNRSIDAMLEIDV